MDLSRHENPSLSKKATKGKEDERQFWTRVDAANVARVADVYRMDLEMLGYSAAGYLAALGVEVPGRVAQMEEEPFIRV